MEQYNKKIQKMINFDDVAKENIKKHNPQISDHWLRWLHLYIDYADYVII